MMQRDYYAFRRTELDGSLDALEQAAEALEEAKQKNDNNARSQAEHQMKQAADKAVKIEPHLAYLWFEAHNSELDNSIRDAWQKSLSAGAFPQAFHLTPDSSVITYLPQLSFMLRIPFKLEKPYLSKDDRLFHILDNPVRKEWLFHVPMVAASSWKGALRAAMLQQLAGWWSSLDPAVREDRDHRKHFVRRRLILARLFGTEKSVQVDDQQFESYLDRLGGDHQARWCRRYVRRCVAINGFFAGRLHFFPTFFDHIGLEVINPHDRKSGVGARGPILMECVPQGAKGELFLLYVPFGASEPAEAEKRREVAEDLEVLVQGIQAMLTTYGFGAKTSSGFGVAKEQLADEGKLSIRAELAGGVTPTIAPPEPPPPDLPRYLESPDRLHTDLRQPDGSLKSEAEYQDLIESRGQKYGKKDKQLYDKAKKWWEGERCAQEEARFEEPEAEAEPRLPEPMLVTEYPFNALSELPGLARRVAEELRKGGGA